MTRSVSVAAVQAAFIGSESECLDTAMGLCRAAANQGANIVLVPELFCGPYFCKTQDEAHFVLARPWQDHPAVLAMSKLAKEFSIVIPVSIFEKDGPHYYNSVVMVDADGAPLGVYRKSHIPDGPGYQEKFYFRPGDTGFKVWDTQKGRIGVGICWDQWFPEAARAMALLGADLLLYPTAIGSEPQDPDLETSGRWQRVMQGHAAANVIPIIAANRIGDEGGQVFYGHSFIADQTGDIVASMTAQQTGFITHVFDLDAIENERAAWGFFRDRRPDLYDGLT